MRDASFTAVMSPKGLAAVVLASIPLEQHLPGGQMLRDVTYVLVFTSIVFTSVLTFLLEKTRLVNVYAALFRGFGRTPTPLPDSLAVPASES